MDRLTRWNDETESAELKNWDKDYWREFMYSLDPVDSMELSTAVEKLAEYEDAEEQGLLVRLPCKVRDRFWELNTVNETPHIYPRMVHSLGHCIYVLERLGKTAFLTREEAEQALRERGPFW